MRPAGVARVEGVEVTGCWGWYLAGLVTPVLICGLLILVTCVSDWWQERKER